MNGPERTDGDEKERRRTRLVSGAAKNTNGANGWRMLRKSQTARPSNAGPVARSPDPQQHSAPAWSQRQIVNCPHACKGLRVQRWDPQSTGTQCGRWEGLSLSWQSSEVGSGPPFYACVCWKKRTFIIFKFWNVSNKSKLKFWFAFFFLGQSIFVGRSWTESTKSGWSRYVSIVAS